MKQVFVYESYSYEYYIEFADRKSLTLVVRPDLRIIVRVPHEATLDEIEAFMRRKWSWLEKQLQIVRKYHKTNRAQQYVSGESFHYLGRQYMLQVDSGTDDVVKLERGKLHISTTKNVRDSAYNRQLFENWLALRRNVVFQREYTRALKLFQYEHTPQLRVRIMQRRWGSYTQDNKISLHPKLIETPSEAIFYILVHELCHVANKKHDKSFYIELEKRIPNWRDIKELLEIRYG